MLANTTPKPTMVRMMKVKATLWLVLYMAPVNSARLTGFRPLLAKGDWYLTTSGMDGGTSGKNLKDIMKSKSKPLYAERLIDN